MENILPRNRLSAIIALFLALLTTATATATAEHPNNNPSPGTTAITTGCFFGILLAACIASFIYAKCCENKNAFNARLLQNNNSSDEPADAYMHV